jgi:hypothetical protein
MLTGKPRKIKAFVQRGLGGRAVGGAVARRDHRPLAGPRAEAGRRTGFDYTPARVATR